MTENPVNNPPKKYKILLTSFGPFEDNVNISQEVAKRFKACEDDIEIVKLTLPNDYKKIKEIIAETIECDKPDFVVSLGEANNDNFTKVPLKTKKLGFGMNFVTRCDNTSSLKDKNGLTVESLGVTKDKRLEISVESDRLVKFTKGAFAKVFGHYSVDTDEHSGEYLCNYASFCAAEAMEKEGKKGMSVFIHLNDIIELRKSGDKYEKAAYRLGTDNYVKVLQEMTKFIKENSATENFVSLYKVADENELTKQEQKTSAEITRTVTGLMQKPTPSMALPPKLPTDSLAPSITEMMRNNFYKYR